MSDRIETIARLRGLTRRRRLAELAVAEGTVRVADAEVARTAARLADPALGSPATSVDDLWRARVAGAAAMEAHESATDRATAADAERRQAVVASQRADRDLRMTEELLERRRSALATAAARSSQRALDEAALLRWSAR